MGGIRTPWTDVPVATLSGLGQSGNLFAILFGTTSPIELDELSRLYPGGQAELPAPGSSPHSTRHRAGFLLAEDRGEILAVAGETFR